VPRWALTKRKFSGEGMHRHTRSKLREGTTTARASAAFSLEIAQFRRIAKEAIMSDIPAIKECLMASLSRSVRSDTPYPHWLLEQCIPADLVDSLTAMAIQPPEIGETKGKRETNNDSRVHFGESNRAKHPIMDGLAHVLQDKEVVDAIKTVTGAKLAGTSLRIEYCQDTGDFWLEPHTDIGVKRFTFLIYLNREPEAADWGTDIYVTPDTYAGRAPAGFNKGLIFIPGTDTWHGFEKRSMQGVRKSLIINYVGPEWRSRQELCFPEAPVQ
jgi:hypothetical protein